MLHYLSLVHSVEYPNDYYSNTDEIELQLAMPVRIIILCT